MIPYLEHRAERLIIAAAYTGWERPPYPFQTPAGHCIGRLVIDRGGARFRSGNQIITLPPGLHRFKSEVEALYKAKEKWQNRTAFGLT